MVGVTGNNGRWLRAYSGRWHMALLRETDEWVSVVQGCRESIPGRDGEMACVNG